MANPPATAPRPTVVDTDEIYVAVSYPGPLPTLGIITTHGIGPLQVLLGAEDCEAGRLTIERSTGTPPIEALDGCLVLFAAAMDGPVIRVVSYGLARFLERAGLRQLKLQADEYLRSSFGFPRPVIAMPPPKSPSANRTSSVWSPSH